MSENKLDKIAEDIHEIKITLAKQHVSLAEHIRRTELLEDKLEPLERRSHMITGVLAFIGLIATLAGIYIALKP